MPLTARSSGGLISAGDINDFRNLLTGVMQDQLVTVKNLCQVKSRNAAPGAATAAVAAGGSINVGAHTYVVTFADAGGGETTAGAGVVATTTGGNQTVNLTVIPTGPTGTTKRNIYRSKVGTTTPLFLLTTINDNTTTTYTDIATDASLPATQPPTHPNFGGSTQWLDSTGAVKAQVYSDGAVTLDAGAIATDGNGVLTVTLNNPNSAAQFAVKALFSNDPVAQNQQAIIFYGKLVADASARVKLWLRPTDGYGQFALAGPNGTTGVCDLWASATGWQTDVDLTIKTNLTISSTSTYGLYKSLQSGGAATGHAFQVWDGSAGFVPLSVGGQFNSAVSYFDKNGSLIATGLQLSSRSGIGGTLPSIGYNSATNILELWAAQAGAAQGIVFNTWNGSAQKLPFSLGGQFGGALAWIDNSGNLSLQGAVSKVGNVATAGLYGVAGVVAVTKDQNVVNNSITNIVSYTTPNDAVNHVLRAYVDMYVGGANTNNGILTAQVAYTDPHAGALTLDFYVMGTTSNINAYAQAKGAGVRSYPRMMNCSPNTTVTITYRNNVAGTISDFATAVLELLG